MVDYKKMYFQLFGAIADAVEALEKNENATAKEILIRAQQKTEELYISAEE